MTGVLSGSTGKISLTSVYTSVEL